MRTQSGRAPFQTGPLTKLQAHQPDFVFIGDSMLPSRIAEGVLEQELGGKKVDLLWEPGSTSARWYLFFKNYLIPSGIKPQKVYFFFRDRFWSLPELNVDGDAWVSIEQVMPDDDELIYKILGKSRVAIPAFPQRISEALYPMQFRHKDASDAFNNTTIAWASARTRTPKSELRRALNDSFSWQNMRPGLAVESLLQLMDKPVPFNPSPQSGFLPEVLRLANENHISLSFVRVERHPLANGDRPETDDLKSYMSNLKAYIETSGAAFIDLSGDREVTADKYGEGDHIAASARSWWTKRFAERMKKEAQP